MHSKCSCQTETLLKSLGRATVYSQEVSVLKHPAPAGPKQIILEAVSDIPAAKRYLPRLSRAAVAHGDKISKDLLNVRPQGSYCYPFKVKMKHDTEEGFPMFSCCHVL